MITVGNPFVKADKQSVIGTLKAVRSRDPDVLHAQKTTLISTVKFPKLVGTYLMVMGGLVSLTIIGAFIGIPMLIAGWWFRWRGKSNITAVETGYAEFVNSRAA